MSIDGNCVGSIRQGIVLLLGIGYEDGPEQIEKLCQKVCKLRIFDDEEGVMNRSLLDIGGEALVVSQFTLMANCRKGNRPSYIEAAKGEVSGRSTSSLSLRCVSSWAQIQLKPVNLEPICR